MLREALIRALLLPLALLLACLLAGLYGALHNQISYSAGPVYFHEFKFLQFRTPPELRNRLGAALIGWRASWWMGLVIGLPVYAMSLFVRGTRAFLRCYLRAALAVLLTTLAAGLAALLYGAVMFTPTRLPGWMAGREVSDPLRFAIAGNMHNFSYLGGLLGIAVAALIVTRAARQSRRVPLSR